MKRRILFSVLLVLLGIGPPAYADGLIIIDETHWHPPRPWPPRQPWMPKPYVFAPLEITYHDVKVKIDGQLATTSVDQEFYNPNSQRLEGTYLFPVPSGAHIDKFSMEIGGKQVDAELLSAEKARGIYEDIVRKLRDPALLEYAGRDVFKVRVFPIEPNSKKRITLSYSQVLKSDAGLVQYVYPLNTEKFSAKPIKKVSIRVALAAPRPLKTIYSPSHPIQIKRDGASRATVVYETAEARPDADFALFFAPEKDEVGMNLLTFKRIGEEGYFLLLASPGIDVNQSQVGAKDVAFVLDTSGSMAGKKLEQAKKALLFCIENLNASDQFEVIRFSTEVEPLFHDFAPASGGNRARADRFIRGLKATGGTALDAALQKALSLRKPVHRTEPRESMSSRLDASGVLRSDASGSKAFERPFVVVFLTDGQPTIGTTDEDQIVSGVKEKDEAGTRVFCFGIGADVNTHLLDKIAERTRAVSQYVLPEEDLELKVSSFFSKITDPVLSNPTLAFDGDVRVSKLYPSPLPDLFKGGQLLVVGRYSGKGDAAVVIKGSVNGATKRFARDVIFPEDASGSDFIPRLWATRRVGFLLDEIRLHGESAELRDEVTDLARAHGIVTPYTAYLIVEDETRRGLAMDVQSFPQLQQDRSANTVAAQNWLDFKHERTGGKALSGARFGLALKSAEAASVAVQEGSLEANRALGVAPDSLAPSAPSMEANVRLAQYTQQTRFVNGKNFFQNQNQWVDAAVQNLRDARRVRVQFNSPEYFELIRREPNSVSWLALGQNVQFVVKETIYEIYE